MLQKGLGSSTNPSQELTDISPDFKGHHSRFIQRTLWFLLLAWVARLTIFVRGRAGSEFTSVDYAATIQIILVVLIFFVVIFSQRLAPAWLKIRKTSLPPYFLYFIICALSTAWSVLPEYTGYRSFEAFSLTLGALIAFSYSPNFMRAERTYLIVALIIVIFSMYVNVKLHGGFQTSLDKWHTNSYTASGALLFCYCLGEYFGSDRKRKKRLKWFGLAGLAAVIIGTSSATFFAALFGIAIIAFLRRNKVLLATAFIATIFVIFVNLFITSDFSGIASQTIYYGKDESGIASGSGRFTMTRNFFEYDFARSPILGNGFGIWERGGGKVRVGAFHSSMLSVLYGTGMVGGLIALFYLFRLMKELYRTTARHLPGAVGCAGAFAAAFVNSFAMPITLAQAEESTVVFNSLSAFFILFVLVPYRQQLGKRTPPSLGPTVSNPLNR